VVVNPVVAGPKPGRLLSTYSKAELETALSNFIRILKSSAYEIIAAISGHLFDFDLIIKQNKPLDARISYLYRRIFPGPEPVGLLPSLQT
jgi:hypothetical protein